MTRRVKCEHRNGGGICYECATGRARKLAPGAIERTVPADMLDSDVRTWREPVDPTPTAKPERQQWANWRDRLLNGTLQ